VKVPFADKIADLPPAPGVYLFLDARDVVIYVGKARNLRARVRQYLRGADGRPQIPFLMRAARDVVITEVGTEKEALILENTLIKKHRPRYNVLQRDDSNFIHLRIDTGGEWPRYEVVRQMGSKGRHFGPYTSTGRARRTLEYLSRRFPLRTCTDAELKRRQRPCLLYEMHRCLAPCVNRCTPEEYGSVLQESLLFLEGRKAELLVRLKDRMETAAEGEHFEDAARTRDLIRAIESSVQAQFVADSKLGDRDAWAMSEDGDRGMAVLLPVRLGRMQEAQRFSLDLRTGSVPELSSSLLNTYYAEKADIPPEVLVDVLPDGVDALAALLTERRGRKVHLWTPQRGDKVRLVRLAALNAKGALARSIGREQHAARALDRLAEVARLQGPPRRIECFDNSNIQGTDPVASMVVFIDGVPHKKAYRRYRVRSVKGPDDYATMREILGRRVRRGLAPDVSKNDALPDLLVVDGGKGQVNVVRAVLADLGVHSLPVIGLAKPKVERARGERWAVDKIVIPGIKEPKRLHSGDPALRLLQALRDESHRTAVRFHRQVRSKTRLTSKLDGIPGVGPARRKALLTHLGSVSAVQRASVPEIAAVPGIGPRLAGVIKELL
jgi:excinuclease ABC subunit C